MDIKNLLPPDSNKIVRTSLEGLVGSRVNSLNYTGNGHWDADWLMGKSDKIGFIYIIRNNLTGRCYIGKKNYRGLGKINKGEKTNWQWYITSSDELSADIKRLGKDNFSFICIEEYKTKGALSWAETWTICYTEAPSNQDKWYNRLINKVSWVVKEPITQRHKDRLELLIKAYTE